MCERPHAAPIYMDPKLRDPGDFLVLMRKMHEGGLSRFTPTCRSKVGAFCVGNRLASSAS